MRQLEVAEDVSDTDREPSLDRRDDTIDRALGALDRAGHLLFDTVKSLLDLRFDVIDLF